MTADRYGRTVPPLARVLSRMVLQPRGLLCGDAEKCLAVQPVAWQHGEPTGSSSWDGDVLLLGCRRSRSSSKLSASRPPGVVKSTAIGAADLLDVYEAVLAEVGKVSPRTLVIEHAPAH
jgi:hypothetical protein